MLPVEHDGWLTIEEVAERLCLLPATVRTYARRDEWRQVRDGHRVYYHPDDVAQHILPRQRSEQELHDSLAGQVTTYRMAIEIARSAIRLGRYDEALATLEAAT